MNVESNELVNTETWSSRKRRFSYWFIIIIIIAGTQWHRTLSETKNKDSSL